MPLYNVCNVTLDDGTKSYIIFMGTGFLKSSRHKIAEANCVEANIVVEHYAQKFNYVDAVILRC